MDLEVGCVFVATVFLACIVICYIGIFTLGLLLMVEERMAFRVVTGKVMENGLMAVRTAIRNQNQNTQCFELCLFLLVFVQGDIAVIIIPNKDRLGLPKNCDSEVGIGALSDGFVIFYLLFGGFVCMYFSIYLSNLSLLQSLANRFKSFGTAIDHEVLNRGFSQASSLTSNPFE